MLIAKLGNAKHQQGSTRYQRSASALYSVPDQIRSHAHYRARPGSSRLRTTTYGMTCLWRRSARGVPSSSGATASGPLEELFTRMRRDALRCAPSQRTTQHQQVGVQPMSRNFALSMLLFAMLASCALGRAQDQEPTIDSTIALVRANMQADRTVLITSGMNFSEKDGATFWPIYRQYEFDRSRLDDRRVTVIKEYAQLISRSSTRCFRLLRSRSSFN